MSKFDNKMYNKGYYDVFSDALNNISIDDVINQLESLSKKELEKIIQKNRGEKL